MSKTASERELLQACIQDLYAGRRLAAERLGCVAGQATTELAAAIESLRHDYAQEAEQLDETGLAQGGPDNVWMAGIFDDADRDTRSVKQGKLLDTALIGAVRKAVAADGVSLETAVEVARSLGNADVQKLAEALRQRSMEADKTLRDLLVKAA
jgi:ferritin-like metal-binding protein YciE